VARQKRLAETRQEIADAYGNVSVEEFDAMRAALAESETRGLRNTLREDYEIFLSEKGEFYASYRGGCAECGFEHKFKHEEQVSLS
jgi:hypothetical protein